jgi:hypothetical protein
MHYIPFSLSVLYYPQLGGLFTSFSLRFLNLDFVFLPFFVMFLMHSLLLCPCACLHLVYVYSDSSAYEFSSPFHGNGTSSGL